MWIEIEWEIQSAPVEFAVVCKIFNEFINYL